MNKDDLSKGAPPALIALIGTLSLPLLAIAAISTYPYPPIDTGCQYTGALVDWASQHGIAALDIELTNHTDTDFDMNLRILNVFMNWKP